jgi:hypothetical protein
MRPAARFSMTGAADLGHLAAVLLEPVLDDLEGIRGELDAFADGDVSAADEPALQRRRFVLRRAFEVVGLALLLCDAFGRCHLSSSSSSRAS